jgi:hypothetical protein
LFLLYNLSPLEKNKRLPAESETVASWIINSLYIGFPGRKTGEPELKVIPACWPKYQLLNSPWEKQVKE